MAVQKLSCGRDLCCVPDINATLEDVLKTGCVCYNDCWSPEPACRVKVWSLVTVVPAFLKIVGRRWRWQRVCVWSGHPKTWRDRWERRDKLL